MAILSNGKFYGFLCSVKETGRKLANGVKEYVEDFVPGKPGHGWKLWEYVKGKWMLEIDALRVRGQFIIFELIVSKIPISSDFGIYPKLHSIPVIVGDR